MGTLLQKKAYPNILPAPLGAALLEEDATTLLDLLFKHAEESYVGLKKGLLEVMLPQIDHWIKQYMEQYSQRAWRPYQHLDIWKAVAVVGIGQLLPLWLEQGAQDRPALVQKTNQLLFCCLQNAQ